MSGEATYIRERTLFDTPSGPSTVRELQRDDDAEFTVSRVQDIGPERSYVVNAQTWTVRETMDPTTATPVLIFSSVGVGRRVRNYPEHWRSLSSEELQALSWSI
jgi:hypothetical protein